MTYDHTNNNAVILKNEKMKKRCQACCNVSLLVLGLSLISLAVGIFFYFEALCDFFLRDAMTFAPSTEPYEVWKTNDPPLVLDIFVFNWTNPEELFEKNVKPKFQELGPYRFKEIKEKINITFHENNTVSYQHRKLYYFDAENSPRQLTDVLNMINIVPLALAYNARHFGYFSKRMISHSLSTFSSVYVTKPVGEILFDGYEESILSIISSIPLTGVSNKLALFKNNTMGSDGSFNMWTKVDDKFGKLMSWNYRNVSDFYEGECGAVKGSAGEFHPFNRTRDYIDIFSSELCKFARFEYEKDVVVKGVKGYKFSGKNVFDNGTLRPENKCFCPGECLPSGVFNVSACREHSPTFLSMPHFYNADPYYINSIEGMKPKDSYELYATLEPRSGIVIDIGAKMQVNMLLQPIEHITMYENVPKVLMPIFYFDQDLPATDDLAALLVRVQSLPEIGNIAVMILVSLGLGSIIWVLLNVYCKKTKKPSQGDEKIAQNTITIDEIPLRC